MPERFIPLGQSASLGGPSGQPGGGDARFVPLGSSANGLNMPALFNQFQGLNQGPSTGAMLARGAGLLGSGLGGINQAGSAYAGLTGGANPIPSGLGAALGIGGNVLGLGSGIYNLSQGNYASAPGVISGLGSLAGGIGSYLGGAGAAGLSGANAAALAGGGAAGAAAAAGPAATLLSGIGAVTGTLALPLAGVGIGLSNMAKKAAKKAKQQTIESYDIRRGYAEAVPNVLRAMEVARSLDRVNDLPPEQQIAALQQGRQLLELGMADLTADFSRFVGTGGQGGAASKVGKVDTSEAQRLSLEAGPDITIGLARVLDALAQRGVVLPAGEVGPTTYQSPASLLNSIIGQAGVPAGTYDPYTALTPQMLAMIGPGNLEAFVTQTLGQLNPQFAQSQIGQRLGTLPTITQPKGAGTILQTVMPQYLAAQNALIQNALSNTTGDPNQGGLNASNIRFFLPYAPGAEAARQANLPAMEERFQREFAARQAETMTGGN